MSSPLLRFVLPLLAACIAAVTCQNAGPCSSTVCVPPACVCSSYIDPYPDMTVDDTPQMVIIVFEGSLNDVTYTTYYQPLFAGVNNANGCPAIATFFIDHKYTDYTSVHKAWSQGHDFGAQSITGLSWTSSSTSDAIYDEVGGVKYYMELYALVNGIVGMRAPASVSGGDAQFQALTQAQLKVDATLVSRNYNNPFWPYTLDYADTQDCQSGPCPKQSYPGIWEFPVTDFIDGNGVICSNLAACIYNNTFVDAYSLLDGNFQYHAAQKAPFVVPIPLTWLYDGNNTNGLIRFLSDVVGRPDTYLLSLNQALAWVQNPVPASQAASFEPWGCDTVRPPDCSATSCKYTFNGEAITFSFCFSANATSCPDTYPWVDNLPWSPTTEV